MPLSVPEMRLRVKEIIKIEMEHRETNKAMLTPLCIKSSYAKERLFRYIHNQDRLNALVSLAEYAKIMQQVYYSKKQNILQPVIKDNEVNYIRVDAKSDFMIQQFIALKDIRKEIEMYCV